jgi:hypothetical protein
MMTTDFNILTAITVPVDYTWDKGVPFESFTTTSPAFTLANYVSGYAPGVEVVLRNVSQIGDIFTDQDILINFNWNFGDIYNNTTNTASLTCVAPVRHIYTMPGRYTITLIHTEIVTQPVDTNPSLCRDRYNINWYWDNLTRLTNLPPKPDAKTWNETACLSSFPKTWDPELFCLQKYCRYWSWENTKSTGRNDTTWEQTQTNGEFEKKWLYESNDTLCQIPEQPLSILVRQERQETIKQFMVEVKELLPRTGLYSITRPIVGTAPLTVQLTPRTTICGSFPIDRIDWDLGDGTPIKTITRQGTPLDPSFINNNVFIGDSLDPRNYDIIHTYNRSIDQYSIFYPSITAYSANTGSYDACSTTIGPVELAGPNEDVSILKVKNSLQGTLYTLDIDDTCTFVTTTTGTINKPVPITFKLPPNKIRDSIYDVVIYQGNIGIGYPPPVEQSCAGYEFIRPLYGLVVEEETKPLTTPLSALSAITQENDAYILVR